MQCKNVCIYFVNEREKNQPVFSLRYSITIYKIIPCKSRKKTIITKCLL